MHSFSHTLSPPHTTVSHSTTLALINRTNLLQLHNLNHNHNHSRISIITSSNSSSNKISAIGNRVGVETEIAVVKIDKPQFEVSRGFPSPFGATAQEDGVNFAVYSLNAQSATLCLFTLSDFKNNKVTEYIALDPLLNKTGCVWHVFLKGDFKDMLYGYKFDGKFSPQQGHYYDSSRVLLDPYAKAVISRGEYGAVGLDGNCWPQMAGMVPFDHEEFDWEGDLPLKYPQKDLIIYEMHVRGFTKHESSKTEFPGTYLGVVEKLDHLKELGINCIELMPCNEFNELEYYSYNAVQGDYRVNFWGYSTINFFSPMIRYSSAGTQNCGHDGINEIKFLIKEAHKRGIEVIMDVVFNHTAEGNEKGPIISFRGVDNSVYYMVAPKLIAEAWDAGGLYQVGTFPHWGIWSEWNGKYRDTVRQFIKGTDGFAGAFAECVCGSPSLYQDITLFLAQGGRKPWNSINLVCAHDGFTLADLVTYNSKHNLPNGEDNNDGENHNNSWNCGEEGEFVSASVKKLRKRQMCNFFLSLMVSQGVPMIFMGDEYGHTKGGNNNTYCHDNYLNYFRWDKKEEFKSDFFRFCSLLIKFRQECESLGLDDFPTSERLQWHGLFPATPDWSETSRFVAFTLVDSVKGEIYIAFNTSHLPFTVTLPERPGYRWEPLIDTSKSTPYDFLTPDLPGRDIAIQQYAHFLDANMYPMLSYSSIILLRTPDVNA
ncbi:isoamylase 1, chloroplastic isoform X3 [Vicia villosa]|uniref:isoamylase 1, chloroplastic isoform X3 n=1 Tax=Vicia villosa TaxID=3911 RepID=UPI00273CF427|nr:isoamylase 1, chloroplastic isoform X3 [Vicia villosa]